MPIEGFNNINSSGVLISSSGFTQLRLEPDGQSLHVGPGTFGEASPKLRLRLRLKEKRRQPLGRRLSLPRTIWQSRHWW